MRRRRHIPHSSHERWLVSYADFITLLFAFFVVLYSTAKADQHKQAQVAQAIDSAFKSLGLFQTDAGAASKTSLASSADQAATPMNVVMGEDPMSPAVQQDLARIKKHLEGLLSNQIAQHTVALRLGRDGLVISLREAGFFDSGSAAPHPASIKTLNKIADALYRTPYQVRIEGHTDNVPIHTDQFDSNWELSTARATRMTRIFIAGHAFDPARLSASGYAEYHPVASNSTEDGRAQNRRVDIIVLPALAPSFSTQPPAVAALSKLSR